MRGKDHTLGKIKRSRDVWTYQVAQIIGYEKKIAQHNVQIAEVKKKLLKEQEITTQVEKKLSILRNHTD